MKSDSVPAFALEKEALKTEIEAGIQTGVEQMESGQKGKKSAGQSGVSDAPSALCAT